MVYKILENGRVKVGLQNAIGAIHMTETANVQNLIYLLGVLDGLRRQFQTRLDGSCHGVVGNLPVDEKL
jgi:uncharacterized membrane protein